MIPTPEMIAAKVAEIEQERREHEAFLAHNVKLADRIVGQLLTGIDALIERIEQQELQTAHNKENDDG